MAKSGDVSKHATGGGIWPLPILGRDGMLLVLTWAAGSVDAISYLGLGHVFTAMMTGNTVLLGLAIGQGQVLAALRSVIALAGFCLGAAVGDRKSTRLNSSHGYISYAVFCLKKKKNNDRTFPSRSYEQLPRRI